MFLFHMVALLSHLKLKTLAGKKYRYCLVQSCKSSTQLLDCLHSLIFLLANQELLVWVHFFLITSCKRQPIPTNILALLNHCFYNYGLSVCWSSYSTMSSDFFHLSFTIYNVDLVLRLLLIWLWERLTSCGFLYNFPKSQYLPGQNIAVLNWWVPKLTFG